MPDLQTTHDQLKQALKSKRDQLTDTHSTRLHRAISWLNCAAQQQDDLDLQLISLWIALNACYAVDQGGSESLAERFAFQGFIEKLVSHDESKAIYACLWETYSGPVKALIKNPYVYGGFWQVKREDPNSEKWREGFNRLSVEALNHLSRQNVPELLGIVLDRLFVLRNQLIHGGATYQSQINREQVQDGAQLLSSLVPIMIEIMLNAESEDWGSIYYPVLKD
ncbi:HEPN domain-containing protein [Oceaniserpentilla sp. 4NH20-0058]|uniref:hypothetical protein n=1 Tax=Oceaniserpentilla sp. 4NH20-0058 TaxID=3127660 RepID=UPI003106FFD9